MTKWTMRKYRVTVRDVYVRKHVHMIVSTSAAQAKQIALADLDYKIAEPTLERHARVEWLGNMDATEFETWKRGTRA